MFGLNKKKPVAEHEASGDIEHVYHEIKQTLRATGVNLNFRTWAAYDDFLPVVWNAVHSNAQTMAFESAADGLRSEAARSATKLGPIDVRSAISLGESQAFQVLGALDLYHYINPKLLLLTSAVLGALRDETPSAGIDQAQSSSSATVQKIARGAPATMMAMEMESDEPEDKKIQQVYDDIQKTLSLRSVNTDYRTLALWPDYLAAAWHRLKPIVNTTEYAKARDELRETSRALARSLPYPVELTRETLAKAVSNVEEVCDVTESFEQLLPGLIINIALLELDWRQGADLERSPFPAAPRRQSLGGVR